MRISKFLIAWGIIALLMTSCKQVVREIDLRRMGSSIGQYG